MVRDDDDMARAVKLTAAIYTNARSRIDDNYYRPMTSTNVDGVDDDDYVDE